MSRPKRRWAWKPNHRRPCHKQYWYAPTTSWYFLRHHWHTHRRQEADALRQLLEDPESDAPFPFHHHHSLAWQWC